jgi:hypothetical protein
MYQIQIEDTIETKLWDEANQTVTERPIEDIEQERQGLLNQKSIEIQEKVDAYKAAQLYQLQNGGPGPSADFEIMKIVNEHQGQFEVVFKSNE